ncbi:MAG: hypothetical protein M3396_03995, partial [Actinomycetota bacterium]|nr:hypothetical protein [Actinomycetota bacterium]
ALASVAVPAAAQVVAVPAAAQVVAAPGDPACAAVSPGAEEGGAGARARNWSRSTPRPPTYRPPPLFPRAR